MKINQLKSFFKKKKIFITGNSGFVGSYLSIALNIMGSYVVGYSLKKNFSGYLSNSSEYKKKIFTINDNILNVSEYKKKIINFKPTILIHLASQPIVKDSYLDAKKTYSTNIMGTVEILEIAKKIKSIKHIIIFTSDKVYENLNGTLLNENSKLGGIDPYSASKSSQDIISKSYKLSFFKKDKNLIILRAGNIIGGGDFNFSRLIPEFFLCINKNKKVIIRNANAVRPWQHILDVTAVILIVISKFCKNVYSKPIIFNIGPNKGSNITVKSLIKILISNIQTSKIIFSKKKKFNESKILNLSNKYIKKKIKWAPKLNIIRSVELTIKWYKNYFKNPQESFTFTVKQIKDYFNLF